MNSPSPQPPLFSAKQDQPTSPLSSTTLNDIAEATSTSFAEDEDNLKLLDPHERFRVLFHDRVWLKYKLGDDFLAYVDDAIRDFLTKSRKHYRRELLKFEGGEGYTKYAEFLKAVLVESERRFRVRPDIQALSSTDSSYLPRIIRLLKVQLIATLELTSIHDYP
jgi:hypothetical protein